MKNIHLHMICVLLLILSASSATATRITADDSEIVCTNWLRYIVARDGDWAGSTTPSIGGVTNLEQDDLLLARIYSIKPSGSVVVTTLKELSPIIAFSVDHDIDADDRGGLAAVLRTKLYGFMASYENTFGSLEAAAADQQGVSDVDDTLSRWRDLSLPADVFAERVSGRSRADKTRGVFLLTTAWHQGAPYNLDCPRGDLTCPYCPDSKSPTGTDPPETPSLVGCVATACAQVMNYHQWPKNGLGTTSYDWDGDQTCDGGPSPDEGQLTADLSDPYDWANMPDDCEGGCTPEQHAAVAELCREVGVALEMDYGVCESSTYFEDVLTVLHEDFLYAPMQLLHRSAYSDADWWQIIKDEIEAERPVLYSFRLDSGGELGHAVVCDGWDTWFTGPAPVVHLNFGWGNEDGGVWIGWFDLEEPFWPGIWPDGEVMIRNIEPISDTWPIVIHVEADGSGDVPTIQDAVDRAASDLCTIELGDGVYSGPGNSNIVDVGKNLTIRSAGGNPQTCTLDCDGFGIQIQPQCLTCWDSLSTSISGITFLGADADYGAGIYDEFQLDDLTVDNCRFLDCSAGMGGGIYSCNNVLASRCQFLGCSADLVGGGIYVAGSLEITGCLFNDNSAQLGTCLMSQNQAPTISGTTFVGNQASLSHISFGNGNEATIANSIFAYNAPGDLVACTYSPLLSCCDVYGNAGGDWTGNIAGQDGVRGNISEDPLFRDLSGGDFHPLLQSPCLHAACGVMGCYGPLLTTSYVATDGDDILGEGTPSAPFATIGHGLEIAAYGDTIQVAPGWYGESGLVMKTGVFLRGEPQSPAAVVIDAASTGGVMQGSGLDATTCISGFTITGSNGTAVYIFDSDPTFSDCIFNNNAGLDGGAFMSDGEESAPQFQRCRFEANSAEGYGGAVCIELGHFSFDDCEFSGNSASENGGAVYIWGSSVASTFTGCSFSGNTAENTGGGVCINQGQTDIEECRFTGNAADLGGAFAALNCYSPTPNFDSSIFAYNTAVLEGGSLYLTGEGFPDVHGCTFHANAAPLGSSIRILASSHLDIQESIIAFGLDGEAVSVDVSSTVSCASSDVYGNQAGDWTGPLASFWGLYDNFSDTPLFCNPSEALLDFRLAANSPCAPFSDLNPTPWPIGALGVGCEGAAGVGDDGPSPPWDLVLEANYPNPFNPSTEIVFRLPAAGRVNLSVYDVAGRMVKTLVDARMEAGRMSLFWDGTNSAGQGSASGTYFLRLQTDQGRRTRKVMLAK